MKGGVFIKFIDRIKNGWKAFSGSLSQGPSGSQIIYTPSQSGGFYPGYEKSIVGSIITRIALDCAQVDLIHAKIDDNGRFKEEIDDSLNRCLKKSSNLDQTGFAFRRDLYMTILASGCAIVVPTVTDKDPKYSESYKIEEFRVGTPQTWYTDSVDVNLYNQLTGMFEIINLPKTLVGIVENPFYSVMNAPMSSLQRLSRKLFILDKMDDTLASNKLNIIIQLPYTIRSELRKQEAAKRLEDFNEQLSKSKFGVAYADGAEKIIQLNRPAENDLLAQITYLTNQSMTQLMITDSILNGTAEKRTMQNYYYRVVDVIVTSAVEEFRRKFLSETARTQGQTIMGFRDPFKLVPAEDMAEIADKYTRNEIFSSNEIRQSMGSRPSSDPRADELRNKNISSTETVVKETIAENSDKEENDGNV